MNSYRLTDPKSLPDNIFRLLDDEWMLITAGDEKNFNTMTASWGGFGIFWNKPVTIAMVRPQRYTRKFIDSFPSFTLSFFEEKYRKALNICGSKSGRDCDKVKEAGLTTALTESGNIYFSEARLVLECKKIYQDDFHESLFLTKNIPDKHYSTKDFHRFYIGEIAHAWQKDSHQS